MRNKLISVLIVISIIFSPLPGLQKPAAAFFGLDDLIVGAAMIIGACAGMTYFESNSRQSTQPPGAPHEAGYRLMVNADVAAPELPADGESNMKVRVLVQKDGNVIEQLPAGLKLFAYHTNGAAELIQTDSADTDFAATGSGNILITKLAPRYGITDRERTLEYYVDPRLYPGMDSVTLKIFRKANNELVYARTESEPLNSSLKPFYWNGRTTGGEDLSPGEYSAELELLTNSGQTLVSPAVELYLNKPIATAAETVPYVGGSTYWLETAPNLAVAGSDSVRFALKDLTNGERTAAEGKVDFSFQPAAAAPAVAEDRLTFSSSLKNLVDGVPVKVEIPGASGEILRVTVFDGSQADQVQYEYNLRTRNILMRTASSSRTYGPGNDNDRAAYYSILKVMGDMVGSAYAGSGLKFDAGTKQLTIDKSKFVDKIDPAYNVSSSTSGDIISLTVSKGPDSVTGNYDLALGTVSLTEGIAFADSYDWDYQSGTIMAGGGGGVAAAGVRAAGLDPAVISRMLCYPIDLMYSLVTLTAQLTAYGVNINTQLQPMPHLDGPEILNIDWADKTTGLISISGTACVERASEMKVYINNAELTDPISWSGQNWTVTNYSQPVQAGRDNKVNVIIRKADGREAESGDVTVYRGLAGQPDLILLSPRDRQVVASDTVPVCEFDLKVCGKTCPNARISLLNQVVTADASGAFSQELYVDKGAGQLEGENAMPVSVTGPGTLTLTKNLIGAYKFIVAGRAQAFVLRKGDLMFNGKSGLTGLFDWVVFDPDHTGIYVGNGQVAEAVWDTVKTTEINDWNNPGFYTATQTPKLVDQAQRDKVVARIVAQTNKGCRYDIPISLGRQDALRFSLKGHYDGPGTDNKFYCSELAYWGWTTTAKENGFDFGVKLEDTMFPARGTPDIENNAILPAYLCEKTMLAGRVNK